MKQTAATVATLAILATLSPAAAHAGGWVCTETDNMIQKYKVVGDTITLEGDAFTILFEDAFRKEGKPYTPSFLWKIILDDKTGLIATMPASGQREFGQLSSVWLDALMIDKTNGNFRHFSLTGGKTPINDYSGGNCVSY